MLWKRKERECISQSCLIFKNNMLWSFQYHLFYFTSYITKYTRKPNARICDNTCKTVINHFIINNEYSYVSTHTGVAYHHSEDNMCDYIASTLSSHPPINLPLQCRVQKSNLSQIIACSNERNNFHKVYILHEGCSCYQFTSFYLTRFCHSSKKCKHGTLV